MSSVCAGVRSFVNRFAGTCANATLFSSFAVIDENVFEHLNNFVSPLSAIVACFDALCSKPKTQHNTKWEQEAKVVES